MKTSSTDDGTNTPEPSGYTHEEHKARAALLGMVYHHGNGDGPFYFKIGEDGIPITESMVDAVTLEPLITKTYYPDGTPLFTLTNVADKVNIKRRHNMMWDNREGKP